MELLRHLIPYILGFGTTLVMTWALIPVARRIGLVDHPNARKHHEGSIPLVGGMAMFCGFAFAVLVPETTLGPQRAMLAGALLLVIAGVLDDFHELSPRSRLIAQIVSGLLMTLWGGVIVWDLGEALAQGEQLELGALAVPFTIFAVVGGINALNMADGVDGLAGGLALIVMIPLTILSWNAGLDRLYPLIGITSSCLLAFWFTNMRFPWRPKAAVFMGDSGSMFIGFLIAWFLADLTQLPDRVLAPVVALYLFAVPLLDTIFIMFRRIREGRSPFSPDRMHLHHLLIDYGLRPGPAVALILVVAAALAVLGIGAESAKVPDNVMLAMFLGLFGIYYWGCSYLRSRTKRESD